MGDRDALERWRRDQASERFRMRILTSRRLSHVPPEATLEAAVDMAEFGRRWNKVDQ